MDFLAWELWLANPGIAEENSWLENVQLIFLFSAIGIHLLRRVQESVETLQIYHVTLALLSFSVVLRELEIDDFGASAMWPVVETAIRAITVLAWLYLAFRLSRNFRSLWRWRSVISRSLKSLHTYAAIAFYSGSWFFDKNHVPIDPQLSKFIEQSLQLGGTVFFLTSALIPPFARCSPMLDLRSLRVRARS